MGAKAIGRPTGPGYKPVEKREARPPRRMPRAAPAKARTRPNPQEPLAAEVRTLLQRIARQLSDADGALSVSPSGSPARDDGNAREHAAFDVAALDGSDVILNLHVDGVRCLLLRDAGGGNGEPPHAPPPDPLDDPFLRVTLSPREQEIARMIAKGHPNKTIARVLEISTWTVGTHLRRIFAKLGVGSRAAMVARVLEARLMYDEASQGGR